MNKITKIIIIVLLAGAIAAVMTLKKSKINPTSQPQITITNTAGNKDCNSQSSYCAPSSCCPVEKTMPGLLDFGAERCIPCKMMMPILKELQDEYPEKFKVEFINVMENSELANKYEIKAIPTQIFLGPCGKELFRHEGFYSKEDILSKWKELGIDVNKDSEQQNKTGAM